MTYCFKSLIFALISCLELRMSAENSKALMGCLREFGEHSPVNEKEEKEEEKEETTTTQEADSVQKRQQQEKHHVNNNLHNKVGNNIGE